MTRAEERALEAYPTQDMYSSLLDGSNRLKREVFINGYEQAEKDINKELMNIMADVSEKQEKAMYADYGIHIDTSNASDTSVAYVFKGDKVVDLLTWEDIKKISRILDIMVDDDLKGEIPKEWGEKEYYEEVLRRFNKAKEEEL